MSERPAHDALGEYLAFLRSTPKFMAEYPIGYGKASPEIDRVMSEVSWTQGHVFPGPTADGDQAIGSGIWVYTADGRLQAFKFGALLHRGSWTCGAGVCWHVEHSLHYPQESSSVWLGVCNNSARYDITDVREAWALWVAGRAQILQQGREQT